MAFLVPTPSQTSYLGSGPSGARAHHTAQISYLGSGPSERGPTTPPVSKADPSATRRHFPNGSGRRRTLTVVTLKVWNTATSAAQA